MSAETASARQLAIGTRTLKYALLRSSRRTLAMQVDANGLRVRAPQRLPLVEIERWLHSRRDWIFDKLTVFAEPRASAFNWSDGAEFVFLGQRVPIRLLDGVAPFVDHDPGRGVLWVGCSDGGSSALRQQVGEWMHRSARAHFRARLAEFAQRLATPPHTLALTQARTRWGSCTSCGTIRLNWRLMHFSPDLIDYVAVHELCHLFEMNHSARFWARVATILPEHRTLRRALHEAARSLTDYWSN